MTIRTIIRYPDPRLALPAEPVTVFDAALRDMLETSMSSRTSRGSAYRFRRGARVLSRSFMKLRLRPWRSLTVAT